MKESTNRALRSLSFALVCIGISLIFLTGCSLQRTAVNLLGSALEGGGGVYASDDDPELIREALPFGLKTYEALLSVSPDHRGLLLSAARGFAAYAYLLQNQADRLDTGDAARAAELRARARKLYLRARDYALWGLEVNHSGFRANLQIDPGAALSITTLDDVPFLYWSGASWAGALSVAKDDLNLVATLPIAGSLVRRILELDEPYEHGAAHEFFISYEGNRPGGSSIRAREHYRRALEISAGQRASIHVALAEAVTIREQNLSEFQALIKAALAVDPEKVPEQRLLNTIARQRALWLQSRIPSFFPEADQGETAR